MTWVQVGELPAGGGELLDWWFSAGFLALGSVEAEGSFAPVIWYSPDGRDWERTDLSSMVTPCPGWTPRPDAWVQDGWAAGGGAVLVGMEYDPDAIVCGSMRPVAWSWGPGGSWTRTHGFRAQGLTFSYPINVWATPAGWETAIMESDGRTWLWQSPDSRSWDRVALMSGNPGVYSVTVANDGTRLLLESDDSGSPSLLKVSGDDGREWRQIDGPPVGALGATVPSQITGVLYPDQYVRDPFWTVVTSDGEQTPATIWTSTNLATWQTATFPMPNIQFMRHTSEGILALGNDPCTVTGSACPPLEPSRYLVSRDGLTWAQLNAPVGPMSFVEGDTGVIIGVGAPSVDGGPAPVYRLDRYSEAEASLLAGMRDDARFGCSPRRSDLPAGATAGVECSPGFAEVDRVGVYRFDSEAALLATYFDRLAEAGVEPRSGDCPAAPGDAAYQGDDAGETLDTHRVGCYVNEFDNANYRITYPEALVYVGVLGTGSNLGTLGDWIWLGDESVPSTPTIWRAVN